MRTGSWPTQYCAWHVLCRHRWSTEAAAVLLTCSWYTSCVDTTVFVSSEISLAPSPNKGSSLAKHSDAEALPLPLVDPHLLSGVQTCQDCPPLPRYQPRVHVLDYMHINIQCIRGVLCICSMCLPQPLTYIEILKNECQWTPCYYLHCRSVSYSMTIYNIS